LTKVELIALVAIAVVLTVLLFIMIWPGPRRPRGAPRLKDQAQIRSIHQSLVVFAKEFGGLYPTPGLIDRLPYDAGNGPQEVPGRGDEDITQNTTANLYSALIMQDYITPELLISPLERNPKVMLKDDYDYERWDPN